MELQINTVKMHTQTRRRKRRLKAFQRRQKCLFQCVRPPTPLLFPRRMYIYIRSKCGPFKYECPRSRPTPPFFTPAPLISREYFHISCGWLMITLHCLMRSFRRVGLFTSAQLVGGWHLFLSDWKALGVSLLKDNNNNIYK